MTSKRIVNSIWSFWLFVFVNLDAAETREKLRNSGVLHSLGFQRF
jgi:hypothetical protein